MSLTPNTRTAIVPTSMVSDGPTYGFAAGNAYGGLLFVSGQLGFSMDGDLPSDPASQGQNALHRLGLVLADAGCSFADIVELRTFHIGDLNDANEWFLPAKAELIKEPYPAWTAVGVASLAVDGAVIEISAIAVIPS
jgi:enamine deaminase RidA (YjgF/YER057c/UK114 family)